MTGAQIPTEIAVRIADRVLLQIGAGLGIDPSWSVESLTPAVLASVQAALAQLSGDGYVTISADHTTITVVPPSATWIAQQAARATLAGYLSAHKSAFSALYSEIVKQNANFTADLTTAAAIIRAYIDNGTLPTASQQLLLLWVLIRLQILELAPLS